MLHVLFLMVIVSQISHCEDLIPGVSNITVTAISDYSLRTGNLEWNQYIQLYFSTNSKFFMNVTKHNLNEIEYSIFDPPKNLYVSTLSNQQLILIF